LKCDGGNGGITGTLLGTGGGTSTVTSGTQTITTISATGGAAGGAGGAGGLGSAGSLNLRGGASPGTVIIRVDVGGCAVLYRTGYGSAVPGGNSILGGGATGANTGVNGGGGAGNSNATAFAGGAGTIIFEW